VSDSDRDANRQLLLRERPTGEIGVEHFELVETPIPEPGDGEVLLRSRWLSFDPAQRGRLNDVRSYVPPVALGAVMEGDGIGEVVASKAPGISVGQLVHAQIGWQEYVVVDPSGGGRFEPVPDDVSEPQHMLGLLGMTGLTAYFGMTDIGRPVEGDAVVVTAAAGATGSIAGQIARIKGAAQVIGTAGSDEKRDWVRDVAGFDDCLDHYADDILRQLRAANRDGYQVVFDNVGGELLDACLFNIAERARVVLCGSISTGYKPQRPDVGLFYYQLLTMRRSRMEGFLVTDYADRFAEARRDLLTWAEEGLLHQQYDVLDGLEQAPVALNRLFRGGNLGKQLVRL
jgi:NADPH-dependent curcumin reductase CurA